MIHRSTGAAIAATLVLCAAAAAQADVIKTTDNQWWPKKIRSDMEGAEAPSDAVLKKSGKSNLELTFDEVTLVGRKFNAAEVAEVYATTAYENPAFRNGHIQGASRYWVEAADSFGEAAETLKGAAKEIALFNRATCLAAANNPSKTLEAAQQLLDAFPRSFYFAHIQDTRARILIKRRDSGGARKALDDVVDAPGMNARDYFAAKLAKVYFFKFKTAGSDKARYADARAEYDGVVREIESRGVTKMVRPQWLMARVGIGRCHVYEQNGTLALPYFDQVIGDKESVKHKNLLARAYTGRGDARYAAVREELAGDEAGDDQAGRITNALTQAALDYVRVAKFYVEYAGDDLYSATVGAARVWATQFHLTGEKDCQLAKRASVYLYAAYQMLPRGEAQRLLGSEVKRLRAKRDEACKVPDTVPPK